MMIFYEYPKCSTCRKAKAELKSLGIEVEAIDIKTNPPQLAILKSWLDSGVELKKLFNTSGNSYRELGLKDKLSTLSVDEALALLAADGMLIKRPILVDGDKVLQIGYRTTYSELGL
ncbi:arsenate reductase family protein [Streptococcus hillyeri]|uniref:Arsenate reductase family protein n=1 Tax=Streptococcus hillyeri TaxID=2282420 RepID=A0A3L9DWT7_9STRE|nr:arsenate reductase family protein [Streptococcus hillyeri]RLY04738.1 arsenate reductase family protein [Streptococcus hillyeri]